MADPQSPEEVSFLEASEIIVKQATALAKIDLDQLVQDWKTIQGLSGPDTWADEDEEDRQKLVRYSDVIDELFALRDEILNRELPPIMEGFYDAVGRWWDNIKDGVKAWWVLLNYGDASSLLAAYRNIALLTSPRAFIGRVDEARKRAEQRLRKKALFAHGEKRFLRKVSHRA